MTTLECHGHDIVGVADLVTMVLNGGRGSGGRVSY